MTAQKSFSHMLHSLKNMLILQAGFLLIMSLFRLVFFLNFAPLNTISKFKFDVIEAFYYGLRMDSVIVGGIQILPTILLIVLYFVKKESLFELSKRFFLFYFIIAYLLCSLLLTADIVFYSYFEEHINPLFFGIIDDDTSALWNIFLTNYNVPLISVAILCYSIFIGVASKKILYRKTVFKTYSLKVLGQVIAILVIISLNVIVVRNSFGIFPFGFYLPDISPDRFINGLTQNGVKAFEKAYKRRLENKKREYDLIKEMGYSGKIEEAFKNHLNKDNINTEDLLSNITYKTPKNNYLEEVKPHVVVIMVEGFSLNLAAYDSDQFNVLGAMRKHFDKDILFANFVSDGNSTIESTQSLVLNIPRRLDASILTGNQYMNISFTYAPPFVYKSKGYETSFVYGGDATWRNVGMFFNKQGFDHVETKAHIVEKLNLGKQCCHVYGVFDEYLYDFVYDKIKSATKPQFIFALSTNNHPPYTIPSDYKGKSLIIPENLRNRLGNRIDKAAKQFKDYQYAVDMAGQFIDRIKQSELREYTIIAVTADNATIHRISMHPEYEVFYKKNIPFYLYLPDKLKPKTPIDTKVFGSHKDIFPTLYHLSLSNANYIAIGTNLLDPQKPHYGFNGYGFIFGKEGFAQFDPRNRKESNPMLEYYKASIAVTEYLVQQQRVRN